MAQISMERTLMLMKVRGILYGSFALFSQHDL